MFHLFLADVSDIMDCINIGRHGSSLITIQANMTQRVCVRARDVHLQIAAGKRSKILSQLQELALISNLAATPWRPSDGI